MKIQNALDKTNVRPTPRFDNASFELTFILISNVSGKYPFLQRIATVLFNMNSRTVMNIC